jgi:teichoic acid transport system permease protein
MLKDIIQNRKLIWKLSKNDFKSKFSGSYLGIIWAFIQPIVTVLVYWFVFEKGLRAGSVNLKSGIEIPFVLWLIAGLVPWFFFQDALSGGTNALLEYSYLVKKVVFNIDVLPIIKVISALFVHLFFVAFTVVLYSCYQYFPDWYTLQVLYYSFAMCMLVLGLVYLTSAIVVFFRDLGQVIAIILQVGVWMTPIMWNINSPNLDLPRWVMIILKLNPMYYVVEGYRQSLIDKVPIWDNPGGLAYFWIFTALAWLCGVHVFRKLKVHFADVL